MSVLLNMNGIQVGAPSGAITNILEFEIDFKPGDDPLKDGFMSKECWSNED